MTTHRNDRNRFLRPMVGALLATLALVAPSAAWAGQEASEQAEPTLIGDSSRDLVFTPVPRCRIIDTRVSGGRLVAGVAREFDVAGPLAGQGGAADCLVPRGPATAVVVNLTVVQPVGAGTLTAWPFGGTAPTATVVSFNARPRTAATGNEVFVAICDSAVASCAHDFVVRTTGGDAHLVGDVAGYFSKVTGVTVPWTAVTGKPAGFADDTDNDTQYSAGAGLSRAGTVFSIVNLGVTASMLAPGAVTAGKVAANAITNAEIVDRTINTADIAVGSITNGELASFAVGANKIASGVVGQPEIATDGVGAAEIAAAAVGADEIAAGAVGRSEIDGNERAIYSMRAACHANGITTSSTCTTPLCTPVPIPLFWSCGNNCDSLGPVECDNVLLGYLLSPAIE